MRLRPVTLLAARAPNLPAAAARTLAALALRDDDPKLAAALAGRGDLDDGARDRLAADTRLQVRAAWLSALTPQRRRRDLDARVLAEEHRAGALAGAATVRGLPDGAYRDLADRAVDKLAVAEPLAVNPDTPEDVRRRAVDRILASQDADKSRGERVARAHPSAVAWMLPHLDERDTRNLLAVAARQVSRRDPARITADAAAAIVTALESIDLSGQRRHLLPVSQLVAAALADGDDRASPRRLAALQPQRGDDIERWCAVRDGQAPLDAAAVDAACNASVPSAVIGDHPALTFDGAQALTYRAEAHGKLPRRTVATIVARHGAAALAGRTSLRVAAEDRLAPPEEIVRAVAEGPPQRLPTSMLFAAIPDTDGLTDAVPNDVAFDAGVGAADSPQRRDAAEEAAAIAAAAVDTVTLATLVAAANDVLRTEFGTRPGVLALADAVADAFAVAHLDSGLERLAEDWAGTLPELIATAAAIPDEGRA